jgi:hypothetical protein
VVVVGVTVAGPPLHDTVPTPLLIEQVVALVTLQARVADWPVMIVAGVAVNETMTGGAGITVTVAVFGVLPPGPVAVNV